MSRRRSCARWIPTECNSIFALPAIWTIDTFGRRNLLLFGLPCMGLMLFWAGSMFFLDADNAARVPILALGMSCSVVVSSPPN